MIRFLFAGLPGLLWFYRKVCGASGFSGRHT